MFCPKCATQHLDGASFCRSCGANISLVPQALSGQLTETRSQTGLDCLTNKKDKLSVEIAFKNIFLGLAFLVISIALSRSIGQVWWFWLLIPAFTSAGKGIGQLFKLREREKQAALNPSYHATFATPPANVPLPAPRRNTGELMSPVSSVTEGTTRHLGVEATTRHLDNNEQSN